MACLGTPGKPTKEDLSKSKRYAGQEWMADPQPNQWETGMMRVPCEATLECVAACFCAPCCMTYNRYLILKGQDASGEYKPENNKCCMGMMDDMCFIGKCCAPCNGISSGGSPGAEIMICCECYACSSCMLSSDRAWVMYNHQIEIDECDGRLIALSNALQILSIVCNVIAAFNPDFQDAADCVDFIADLVYWVVSSCMMAQTNLQLKKHPHAGAYGASSTTTVAPE